MGCCCSISSSGEDGTPSQGPRRVSLDKQLLPPQVGQHPNGLAQHPAKASPVPVNIPIDILLTPDENSPALIIKQAVEAERHPASGLSALLPTRPTSAASPGSIVSAGEKRFGRVSMGQPSSSNSDHLDISQKNRSGPQRQASCQISHTGEASSSDSDHPLEIRCNNHQGTKPRPQPQQQCNGEESSSDSIFSDARSVVSRDHPNVSV